jgi:N-acyl-D-aspartate/D-glutamate deacylase
MPESDIVKWLRLPGETMASDGMPIPGEWSWDTPYDKLPNMHPRGAGSRGASLRLARENKIAMMQVLAMLSYNSAKYLGNMGLESMKVRGRMQEGMVADITIFDPERVTDNSTYKKATLPTTGIPYVLVNGVIVVKDSQVLPNVFPGQALRFPPEEKGRFKPLSVEDWQEQYMVPAVDFGGLSKLPGKKAEN